jgi:phosphoribosyl 1,2-cyclic phosphodiesterase
VVVDAFATITQRRMTGGFRIDGIDGKNLHLDPGPGALVRSYQFGVNPLKLHGILVSHSHTDHYSDAEVLIEAMTRGMTRKKGLVIGSPSVINGYKQWGPCISHYHLSKPRVEVMESGQILRLDDLKVTATPTIHGDPKNIGFRLEWDGFTLSYTSDTAYFEELQEHHQDTDVLIGSVIRPGDEKIRGHMCANEFKKLIQETKPKMAIMTHLGMKLITDHPTEEATRISKEIGIKTIAAQDGMVINLDKFRSQQHTLDEY